MEKWPEFVWHLFIGVLVIFFGGWLLGSFLNLVAMASPHMVSQMFCPAGSTATYGSAFNQPSNNGTISCQDKAGASVPALSNADSIVLQRKYFYLPSNIIMIILVIGWFIWRLIWRRKKNEANL
jgi:hypothetical protein